MPRSFDVNVIKHAITFVTRAASARPIEHSVARMCRNNAAVLHIPSSS